ncbi:hypothetical protein VTN77DRAFT_8172 [Rasamsonia byssochlamydoides]|uniref:uncharacterized protein n=1 Tax=Rasamsonia byssochlamydoides TaxID=89139 RepID=UPI0037437A85
MGGAEEYLPAPFEDEEILALLDSISLGHPISIERLKVTAAFHAIYILTYDSKTLLEKKLPATSSTTTDLVLRISGDHVPSIKTENEAAVLSWLRDNTSVPVPEVICYDPTTANLLKREFIILSRCPGITVSDIYDSLSPEQLDSILKQLMKILLELHAHPFEMIGGLVHSRGGDNPKEIGPGPVLDEHFWFVPDIEKYFTNETFFSLNIEGPFPTYTAYTIATMEKYIHIAQVQPSLTFLHKYIPRLTAFLHALPKHAAILDNAPIRLAHKDLHFANILYDSSRDLVTGILDWEFAGTVPFPRWDPVRAFLWNGKPGEDSLKEKYRLRDRFAELCREEGVDFLLKDAEFTSKLQEKMHLVTNMMRIMVTLVPRGQFVDHVPEFEAELVKGLDAFGV